MLMFMIPVPVPVLCPLAQKPLCLEHGLCSSDDSSLFWRAVLSTGCLSQETIEVYKHNNLHLPIHVLCSFAFFAAYLHRTRRRRAIIGSAVTTRHKYELPPHGSICIDVAILTPLTTSRSVTESGAGAVVIAAPRHLLYDVAMSLSRTI